MKGLNGDQFLKLSWSELESYPDYSVCKRYENVHFGQNTEVSGAEQSFHTIHVLTQPTAYVTHLQTTACTLNQSTLVLQVFSTRIL